MPGRGSCYRWWAVVAVVAGMSAPASAVDWEIETINTNGTGDVSDDMAVWVNNSDPTKSVIIGTNKSSGSNGGLYTYALDGGRSDGATTWDADNWFDQGKKVNNVDIRHGFDANGVDWDIVATSNRTNDRVDLFRVTTDGSGDFAGLVSVGSFSTSTLGGDNPYGLAMYHSQSQNKFYVIASSKNGDVAQWELSYNIGTSLIDASKIWQASVDSSEIEGIVADDNRDVVYIAAENTAIYRYSTSSGTIVNSGRVTVDTAGDGNLVDDIEGLTMYYASAGRGYLIASSQGSDDFDIYDREYSGSAANAHLLDFSVTDGAGSDDVTSTDGIDVVSVGLGGNFSDGMLLVHDSDNSSGPSNFKLVPWKDVAAELP